MDDPRLPLFLHSEGEGTLQRQSGISGSNFGLTQKDISISMQTIDSKNSKIIDSSSARRSLWRDLINLNLMYPEDQA